MVTAKHLLFIFFSGGQFAPVCTGQFEPAKVVSLNRSEVVNFTGFCNLGSGTKDCGFGQRE